eukprot:785856-Pyramimonas_sp.AAC.1
MAARLSTPGLASVLSYTCIPYLCPGGRRCRQRIQECVCSVRHAPHVRTSIIFIRSSPSDERRGPLEARCPIRLAECVLPLEGRALHSRHNTQLALVIGLRVAIQPFPQNPPTPEQGVPKNHRNLTYKWKCSAHVVPVMFTKT